MRCLSPGAIERTSNLIARYGMHDEYAILPVPIKQVAKEEGWRIFYHGEMGKMVAMAVSVGGVKLMYVNANLTIQAQRVGIAHELGHELGGHLLPVDTFMGRRWRHEGLGNSTDAQEEEASLLGCLLLVPAWLYDSPLPAQEVADTCHVLLGTVTIARGAMTAPIALAS